MTGVFKAYHRLLMQRPHLVHGFQTAGLMILGDVICQTIAEKKSHTQINFYRSLKFGSIGFVLGPAIGSWYKILDKVGGSSAKIAVVKRIVLDQIIFAPSAVFFITMAASAIDGKTMDEIIIKMKKDYFHIVLTNYKVWPLVQSINFTLVPLQYRVLVTQTVAVGWNAYLSWKINADDNQS